MRTDAISAAVSETGSIATILADQLFRSIQAIDVVLMEMKTSTESMDIDAPLGFRRVFERRGFQETLTKYRNRLPQAFNIVIADSEGQIVVSTAAWPTPKINIADRDYFQDVRNRADDRLVTSLPIENRIDNKAHYCVRSATGEL